MISPVEKRDGGTFWMRVGTAYVNKDESINVYLDAMPKTFQLQLRELTEEDYARRESYQARAAAQQATTQSSARAGAPFTQNLPDQLPF